MSKVSDQELLAAFERMCRALGKVSRGFDVDAITAPIDGPRHDGTTQWAMKRVEGFGWMVVCGAGGCGAALSRGAGYVKKKWDFLMLIEAVAQAAQMARTERER